jgi:hypothetical protein
MVHHQQADARRAHPGDKEVARGFQRETAAKKGTAQHLTTEKRHVN